MLRSATKLRRARRAGFADRRGHDSLLGCSAVEREIRGWAGELGSRYSPSRVNVRNSDRGHEDLRYITGPKYM